jgi:thioredoxin 1
MKKELFLILLVAIMLFISCQKGNAETKEIAKPAPLVTFVELGSVTCIPCKMMQPVMEEIEKTYGDKIKVDFYNVTKPENKAISASYKIRVIPTQIFLDAQGVEFHRHEGFYSKDEIVKIVDKQLELQRTIKK